MKRGKMRCAKARKLLPLYVDRGLSEGRESGVREHLETCAECRAELAGLREALGLLRRLPDLKAPVAFRRSIINAVRQAAYEAQAGRRRRVPTFATPRLAYAAAAVALLVFGLVIGRLSITPAPTPTPDRVELAVEPPPQPPEVIPVTGDELGETEGPPPALVGLSPEERRPARRASRGETEGAEAGALPGEASPAPDEPGELEEPEEPPTVIPISPRVIEEGPNSRPVLAGGFLVLKPLPSTETPEMGEAKLELVNSAVGAQPVKGLVEELIDDEDIALEYLLEVFTENDWQRVVESATYPESSSS